MKKPAWQLLPQQWEDILCSVYLVMNTHLQSSHSIAQDQRSCTGSRQLWLYCQRNICACLQRTIFVKVILLFVHYDLFLPISIIFHVQIHISSSMSLSSSNKHLSNNRNVNIGPIEYKTALWQYLSPSQNILDSLFSLILWFHVSSPVLVPHVQALSQCQCSYHRHHG